MCIVLAQYKPFLLSPQTAWSHLAVSCHFTVFKPHNTRKIFKCFNSDFSVILSALKKKKAKKNCHKTVVQWGGTAVLKMCIDKCSQHKKFIVVNTNGNELLEDVRLNGVLATVQFVDGSANALLLFPLRGAGGTLSP